MFTILSTCKGGGYRYCRTDPPHPRRNAKGLYPLHIVKMENKLGRLLVSGEQVHHRDEDKTNDAEDNLEVLSTSAHAKLHWKDRTPRLRRSKCVCGTVIILKPHLVRLRQVRNETGELFCSRACGARAAHQRRAASNPLCPPELPQAAP